LETQCEYRSIAAARRAVQELQKHAWGFKVVTGSCGISEEINMLAATALMVRQYDKKIEDRFNERKDQ
jgi:hypothetical protein